MLFTPSSRHPRKGARAQQLRRPSRPCRPRLFWLEDRALPSVLPGADFEDSTPISLDPGGSGSALQPIPEAQAHFFELTATASGRLLIGVHSTSPDSGGTGVSQVVTAYDGGRNQLAGVAPTLLIDVTAGNSYFLKVEPQGFGRVGGYALDLATALPLPLAPDGSGDASGTIGGPSAGRLYDFVAPATESLGIFLGASTGSTLDLGGARLDVLDASLQPLGTATSLLQQLPVFAGQTYYVAVSSARSTGGFQLSTFPLQPLSVGILPLSGASQSGSIDGPGRVATFSFVPIATGRLTIEQDAAPGSSLAGDVAVLEASGTVITSHDDVDAAADRPDRVTVDVVAGQTYFVRAGATPASSGGFTLNFSAIQQREAKPDDSTTRADPIAIGGPLLGTTTPGQVAFYRIYPSSDGLLVARVHADGAHTRLALLDGGGAVLVESDGITPGNRDDLIQQHLLPGTYFLEVEGLEVAGDYTLSTSLTTTAVPLTPQGGSGVITFADAVADLNGDAIPDLVEQDGVRLGVGDGTFQDRPIPVRFDAAGFAPLGVVADTTPGQSFHDLAAVVPLADGGAGVTVLINQPGGLFGDPILLPVRVTLPAGTTSGVPRGQTIPLAWGQFDGRTDLAVAEADGSIALFRIEGGAAFQVATTRASLDTPAQLVPGDYDGDGKLDLAVRSSGGDVSLLFGAGDGTFRAPVPVAQGSFIVAGRFVTGDVRTELAVLGVDGTTVSLLEDRGPGRFQPASAAVTIDRGQSLLAGDFNGDGNLDLAFDPLPDTEVAVLLGAGDGSFRPTPVTSVSQLFGTTLIAADLDRDGRTDLVAEGQYITQGTFTFLGNGDGTFQSKAQPPSGSGYYFPAPGFFTRSGQEDLVVTEQSNNDLYIFINNGDGTFRDGPPSPAGESPGFPVVGDFNNDGRSDVAVVDEGAFNLTQLQGLLGSPDAIVGFLRNSGAYGSFDATGRYFVFKDFKNTGVTILTNVGNANFAPPSFIPLDKNPVVVATGDFDGDGNLDLVVGGIEAIDLRSLSFVATFSVLFGDGHGGFSSPSFLAKLEVGNNPQLLVTGAFEGHNGGRSDIAILAAGGEVDVFRGNADRTLTPLAPVATGEPLASSIVAGGFGKDHVTDLAVYDGADVVLLTSRGDGTFEVGAPIAAPIPGTEAGNTPPTILGYDIRQDGNVDIVAFNGSTTVVALLNDGTGGFEPPQAISLGPGLRDELASKLHVDAHLANIYANGLAEIYGLEGLDSRNAGASVIGSHPNPVFVADPGTQRRMIGDVRSTGDIIVREIRQDGSGTLSPPTVINPGAPSLGIAAVAAPAGHGPLLASVDAADNSVRLFAFDGLGNLAPVGGLLPTGGLPAQIVSADLNGDGWGDLVVRNAGDGTLSIYLSDGKGAFGPRTDVEIGTGASDMVVAATGPGGTPDIVIADRVSGVVRVLSASGGGSFAFRASVYRAGSGPAWIDPGDAKTFTAEEQSLGVGVGTFVAGGAPDIVVANPGTNTLGLLRGLGGGGRGFANPVAVPTPNPARAIVVADFNHDGVSDLAVLDSTDIVIELGDGRGGLSLAHAYPYPAGFNPTGLSVVDINRDGNLDLLAGNADGDVLALYGNANGTFQRYDPKNPNVSLAVASFTGTDGQTQTIAAIADPANDRVFVSQVAGQPSVISPTQPVAGLDQQHGLQMPGTLKLADLNGDGLIDLIVVDSLSDDVLVFPGLPGGGFGPELNGGLGFFTGTTPVGITAVGIHDDGTIDHHLDLIVANQGSDDVTLLYYKPLPGGFTYTEGPRLQAGSGPVSTAVLNDPGNGGLPALLVTDSLSNDVAVLPGRGNGFFDDRNPTFIPVGVGPGTLLPAPFVPQGGTQVAIIEPGARDVRVITGILGPDPQSQVFPLRSAPVAAAMFQDGGLDGLLVAESDAHLAVLLYGAGGLSLSDQQVAGLPEVAALASSVSDGEVLRFYATPVGELEAVLEELSLSETVVGGANNTTLTQGLSFGPYGLPGFVSTGSGSIELVELTGLPSSNLAPVLSELAVLLPLQEASLPLIGTLLIVTLVSDRAPLSALDSAVQGTTTDVVSFLVGPSVGQGMLASTSAGLISQDGEEGGSIAPTAAGGPEKSYVASWEDYILGVNQAIDRLRGDVLPLLLTDGPPEAPAHEAILPWEDAPQFEAPEEDLLKDQAIGPAAGRALPADRDGTAAVDAVLKVWGDQPDPAARTVPRRLAAHTSVRADAPAEALSPPSPGDGGTGWPIEVPFAVLLAPLVAGRLVPSITRYRRLLREPWAEEKDRDEPRKLSS